LFEWLGIAPRFGLARNCSAMDLRKAFADRLPCCRMDTATAAPDAARPRKMFNPNAAAVRVETFRTLEEQHCLREVAVQVSGQHRAQCSLAILVRW
jgi:hypothetical protein